MANGAMSGASSSVPGSELSPAPTGGVAVCLNAGIDQQAPMSDRVCPSSIDQQAFSNVSVPHFGDVLSAMAAAKRAERIHKSSSRATGDANNSDIDPMQLPGGDP